MSCAQPFELEAKLGKRFWRSNAYGWFVGGAQVTNLSMWFSWKTMQLGWEIWPTWSFFTSILRVIGPMHRRLRCHNHSISSGSRHDNCGHLSNERRYWLQRPKSLRTFEDKVKTPKAFNNLNFYKLKHKNKSLQQTKQSKFEA